VNGVEDPSENVKTNDSDEGHLNDETTNSDPEVEQLMKLPETVSQLTSKDGVKVYLVGTAHFSLESQEDVAKVKHSMSFFCLIKYFFPLLADNSHDTSSSCCRRTLRFSPQYSSL
jgi:hypothetical protein